MTWIKSLREATVVLIDLALSGGALALLLAIQSAMVEPTRRPARIQAPLISTITEPARPASQDPIGRSLGLNSTWTGFTNR